ncbi:MAG: tryptophan synthase subunit alpha [Thermodesulfobacteriota bacterium]|nr:tryptophan synthase subunit alpha [Thermodesulfobacteriota bacterium]
MNRIDHLFETLRAKEKTALMPFLVAGDPTIAHTADLIRAVEQAGADIIELGVPFSDPIADGPTIQAASQRALASGATLGRALDIVHDLRKDVHLPIVLMCYYNLLYQYPLERFAQQAAAAGIDGVIVPDLPPEEADPWRRVAKRTKIHTIFLVTPTTPLHRVKAIDRLSNGFLYYVSVTGVTGARDDLPQDLAVALDRTRREVRNPLAVGFGIGAASQVAALAPHTDGIIVGSALVKVIEQHRKTSTLLHRVSSFIKDLKRPLL